MHSTFADKPMQQPYEFIFINKDRTSATLSCGPQLSASAIQRHVQIVSAKTTRANRIKSLHASSSATRKIAREGFTFKQRWKEEEEEVAAKSEHDERVFIEVHDSKQASRSSVRSTVPWNPIDPFNSTVARFSPSIMSVLHFHLSNPFMLFAIRRAYATGQSDKHRHSSAANEIIKGCLANETNLYALLAAAAERFTLFTGKHIPEAGQFMHRAILAMQKYLKGPK